MVHRADLMVLPYAPNAVPLGTNPGGRKLTTRIHNVAHIVEPTLILAHNPNRLAVWISFDNNEYSGFEQISIDPDDPNSWVTPYAGFSGFIIYGNMSIYARLRLDKTTELFGLDVFEYVYE